MAPAATLVDRQDATTTAAAPPSATSSTSSTSHKVLYIAVGVSVAAVALIAACICICCYRRRRRGRTPVVSKPAIKPEAFTLQSQHKPPSTAPAKPSHYGGTAGYTASAEQSHGLLANAAPTAEGPVPTAYTGELYGQQPQRPPHAAPNHGPLTQHPTQHHPHPNAASQGPNTHSQSPHRPPHPPTASEPPQQAAANHGHGQGYGPSISITPPAQTTQQLAPARPPKIGEAAVYFDTSVHIGTQRGRRADRPSSAEHEQIMQNRVRERSV